MKTHKITMIAVTALAALVVSCKKEKPAGPVNKDLTEAEPCSFCPGESLVLDSQGMVNEDYAHQVPFYHSDTEAFAASSNGKTALGFYGYHEGMAIDFNLAQLPLACVSNKITFAHARSVSNTNDNPRLVNVKFPTTPLIITTPDQLGAALAPYGYSVQEFSNPGYVNMGMTTSAGGFPGVVDSIIITGPEFETVTVGANLFESELRSICISHQ